MGSREYRNFTTKKMEEMLKRNVIWGDKWTTHFKPGRKQGTDASGNKFDKSNVFIKLRRIVEKDPEPTNT